MREATKSGTFQVTVRNGVVTFTTPDAEYELPWYEASDLARVMKSASSEAKPETIDERVEDLKNTPYGRP